MDLGQNDFMKSVSHQDYDSTHLQSLDLFEQTFECEEKPMPHKPASSALSHIRVLDLTRVRSGPTAVRQLGDWGADVIKIEQPASLEADGSLGAGRNTADWQNLQRNRRSFTLNLKNEKGRELFFKVYPQEERELVKFMLEPFYSEFPYQ